MSFSTKKYTRPVLLNNLRKLKSSDFSSVSALASALSPRAGRKSAQFAALNNYVRVASIIGKNSNPNLSKKIILTSLSGKSSSALVKLSTNSLVNVKFSK